MRAGWAVVAGLALGIGLAWWLARDTPQQAQAKRERAAQAAAANAEDARPALYRWRDAAGVLQITEQPPQGKDAGRKYERIDPQPRPGIEVHGDRDAR
ncbi:DUF4124 domain-containing protein [Cognatiluteimonas weifangensis]|uniref:DUF4124 domain-containing protein n=1 Tax=Cognatiluteimonas weifangensis TaxID=2303539 RepID=UPI001314F6A4|nr:DUF4124 domain-containing protein [Luteimonas weifangensis]